MRRETSNSIRFVIEDLLPPILRDSAPFRWLATAAWGKHVLNLEQFKKRSAFLTDQEYENIYRAHPSPHGHTDNSQACLEQIARDVAGSTICDVGCGTGYLLKFIKQSGKSFVRAVGVDFVKSPGFEEGDIEFVDSKVEQLPFADKEFDTVVCTHLIEHILDYRKAIAELRRIAKKRLIIVVPREREALVAFNPHFNFFPYTHSFLRAMIPVPQDHECFLIGRDIYYREDIA